MSTMQDQETSTAHTEESLPAVVEVSKDDSQIFSVLDRLDDDLILAEIENRVVTEWVYRFKQEGKEVCNLSKAGVDACCTEMARTGHIIEEEPVKYTQDPSDPEYFLFTVVARRVLIDQGGERKLMETVNGAKRQHIKMFTKSKGMQPDPFWFEKGAMKACRNARNRLIPEDVKVKIMAAAKADGRVKHVTKKDVESTPQPQPEKSKGKTPQSKGEVIQFADREKVNDWIIDNIGPEDRHKKAFKDWCASFPNPKISKNQFGHYTLDKVDAIFVQRLYANPDNAVATFSSWYDMEKAKETVQEVFPESEVVDAEPS